MKAAIQYFFFLLVVLLLGVGNLHASKPLVGASKIITPRQTLETTSHHFFDQVPVGSDEDESVMNDEDDEDDCCFKKQSSFFKSFLALTQYFQVELNQRKTTNGLLLDEHFSLGSPRYILQRAIKI